MSKVNTYDWDKMIEGNDAVWNAVSNLVKTVNKYYKLSSEEIDIIIDGNNKILEHILKQREQNMKEYYSIQEKKRKCVQSS